jgi:phosphatidate phosphatase APP1
MSNPEPFFTDDPASVGYNPDSAIASITILVFDWAPGQSEVRLQLPAEAEPGQSNAVAAQAKFRARLITDIDDAIRLLGGP